MNDRLRLAATRIQQDLAAHSVPAGFSSPLSGGGYFEYTEGPIGPVVRPEAVFVNTDTGQSDTTIIDNDDMLMFTVNSSSEQFTGISPTGSHSPHHGTGYRPHRHNAPVEPGGDCPVRPRPDALSPRAIDRAGRDRFG